MDAFERLRGLVLADDELQEHLRAHIHWDDFAAAAAEVAGQAGFSIARGELEAARRAARRSWAQRDLASAGPARLDDVVPHGWTPVDFSPEAVRWCDLRGVSRPGTPLTPARAGPP